MEQMLTTQELAEVLGFAAGTIVDWAEAGKLPAFKLGGRLRFRLSEVETWLEHQRMNGPSAGGGCTHPTASARGVVLQAHPSLSEEAQPNA